jgi:transposase
MTQALHNQRLRSKCHTVHKQRQYSPSDLELLRTMLKQSATKKQFRHVLCIWLRASLLLNSQQIALALDMTDAAVRKSQSRYFKRGPAVFDNNGAGGRRRAYLDPSREAQIVKKFRRRARGGHALDVRELKRAYELSVGQRVSKSTVYRLIARHGLKYSLPRMRRSTQASTT